MPRDLFAFRRICIIFKNCVLVEFICLRVSLTFQRSIQGWNLLCSVSFSDQQVINFFKPCG
uniref:Uncharacterized protein n=1 Tax=Ascaris lumbricoides TaxID=6252 RepID=A0A0M3ILV1_ASCLU